MPGDSLPTYPERLCRVSGRATRPSSFILAFAVSQRLHIYIPAGEIAPLPTRPSRYRARPSFSRCVQTFTGLEKLTDLQYPGQVLRQADITPLYLGIASQLQCPTWYSLRMVPEQRQRRGHGSEFLFASVPARCLARLATGKNPPRNPTRSHGYTPGL